MGLVRRAFGRGLIVSAVVALATAGAMFAMTATSGADIQSVEEPGEHDWVVPENVCWVTFQVWGAQGGDGAVVTPPAGAEATANTSDANATDSGGDGPAVPATAEGGEGGFAQARIPVTPGETLRVIVGEAGADGSGQTGGEGGESEAGHGGDGGNSTGPGFLGATLAGGGGGGGASSVDRGDKEIVIAGGGGGGGGTNGTTKTTTGVPGGDGGGNGEDGATPTSKTSTLPGAEGGEAGGDGGEGGAGAGINAPSGEDGGHNEGGDGATAEFQGGGGGGGGSTGGGGGGGAALNSLFGGGGGGGGEGDGPEGTKFENGGNDGDGEIVISFDPRLDACSAQAITVTPKFTG
jgi:hypothetical protein